MSTPALAQTDSFPIDRAALLDRVGGDEDLLRELTAIFLTEYPLLLLEIETGLVEGNAQRVELAAHSLKGSVANFGARNALEAARCMEALARGCDLSGAREALSHLRFEFEQLQPCLQQLSE